MDGLDLLKKDWNKASADKKLSAQDIYSMLHKKSSSIVKTLFYISVAELVFWILVNSIPYFVSDAFREKLDSIYSDDLTLGLTIFSYAVIILFIILLFRSYKTISVTDSAKQLMANILRTRKIIKYYVLYNLIMAGVSMVLALYHSFHYDPNARQIMENLDTNGIAIFIAFSILFTAILILIIWLFYKLIYGLLLKRLNRNYKELEELED
ncbi:hypothetical protein H7U19_04875 [Hyunsoonleella sp. SJ7]|uniref:Uncharacterized protein n=1 Tax=Hyunsoonleella aquatilis TaxID=2762758 RepID=A0A923HE21_9FLAO|nr:hypothetical protein [Hyunsoonleella aquatilis]MBC3757725.1 hypothetical protein [Hyunsoonleella aquatilis]